MENAHYCFHIVLCNNTLQPLLSSRGRACEYIAYVVCVVICNSLHHS